MRIGIIGAGVMGEVITSSLLKKNILEPGDIMLGDQDISRLTHLEKLYRVKTTRDNHKLLAFSDIVLFCVKPQNSRPMMEELTGRFSDEQIIVSIMAGVSLGTIERLTGHGALVRAMPNIPARIGKGMTVWMASSSVSDKNRMIVKMIFQAFGLEMEVADEDRVDAATAVSGSGPAYIFYTAENLMRAAVDLGFSSGEAHRLVQQTFQGAMDLWVETSDEPETLRRTVTSKGGTTAAALDVFKKRETPRIFSDAIRAAYVRAGELRQVADGEPDPEPPSDSENGD